VPLMLGELGPPDDSPVLTPCVPLALTADQLTPSAIPAVRLASRKRTSSITCCEGATCIAFTTSLPPDRLLATCTARSAPTASRATPPSTICPPTEETWMPPVPVLERITRIFCCSPA